MLEYITGGLETRAEFECGYCGLTGMLVAVPNGAAMGLWEILGADGGFESLVSFSRAKRIGPVEQGSR